MFFFFSSGSVLSPFNYNGFVAKIEFVPRENNNNNNNNNNNRNGGSSSTSGSSSGSNTNSRSSPKKEEPKVVDGEEVFNFTHLHSKANLKARLFY